MNSNPLTVRIVSAITGTDSIDVMEDRGSAVFDSRQVAQEYLRERDFGASLAIVEANR